MSESKEPSNVIFQHCSRRGRKSREEAKELRRSRREEKSTLSLSRDGKSGQGRSRRQKRQSCSSAVSTAAQLGWTRDSEIPKFPERRPKIIDRPHGASPGLQSLGRPYDKQRSSKDRGLEANWRGQTAREEAFEEPIRFIRKKVRQHYSLQLSTDRFLEELSNYWARSVWYRNKTHENHTTKESKIDLITWNIQ